MTRLVALADTHGDTASIREAMPLIRALEPLAIYHLGDLTRDAMFLKTLTDIPVFALRGNCDGAGEDDGVMREDTYEGARLLAAHGHTWRVKSGTEALCAAARTRGCAVALYGHTHIASVEETDGVLLVNPGSLAQPRGGDKGTIALLMIDGDRAEATLLRP